MSKDNFIYADGNFLYDYLLKIYLDLNIYKKQTEKELSALFIDHRGDVYTVFINYQNFDQNIDYFIKNKQVNFQNDIF